MNDDAKFFFFLSGFVGFVFFYAFSLLLYKDLVISLLSGAIGSLVFSSFGRIILISALKKVQNSQSGTSSSPALSKRQIDGEEPFLGKQKDPAIDSSVRANLEAVAKNSKSMKPPSITK